MAYICTYSIYSMHVCMFIYMYIGCLSIVVHFSERKMKNLNHLHMLNDVIVFGLISYFTLSGWLCCQISRTFLASLPKLNAKSNLLVRLSLSLRNINIVKPLSFILHCSIIIRKLIDCKSRLFVAHVLAVSTFL